MGNQINGIRKQNSYSISARRDHLARKIAPALDDGLWVLCDRFVDSTYAYQGYGYGISPNLIDNIYKFVADEVFPDLTFILDLNPEEGFKERKNDHYQIKRFCLKIDTREWSLNFTNVLERASKR